MKHLKKLKIFSNADALNLKISFLKSLDKGIRGTRSMILDFFECRVNTDEYKDNYMIVYASQSEIGNILGFTREYISHCINRMSKSPKCPFAVFVAVAIGIPLYSNAAGVIPFVSELTRAGVAMDTLRSFIMAVTALSIPEITL